MNVMNLRNRSGGCAEKDPEERALKAYETQEYAENFLPCALFLTADDELVNPDHSRMLAAALDKHSIPCRLEIGPAGGHGFADGSEMCMEGWTARASAGMNRRSSQADEGERKRMIDE